jgi:transposase InsO family protein
MLCQLLAVARSSYYDYLRQKNQKAQGHKRKKPGPKVQLDDKALLQAILDVMTASPFVTEGIKKVHARLRRIRGCVGKGTGDGIAIRHDWGPQYIAHDFKKELEFFGLRNSPALVHEPQTNGVIERFFKTLKLECLWIENFRDVEHAREVVGRWMETYNTQWLIERNGYRTPHEVRQACQESQSVVA